MKTKGLESRAVKNEKRSKKKRPEEKYTTREGGDWRWPTKGKAAAKPSAKKPD